MLVISPSKNKIEKLHSKFDVFKHLDRFLVKGNHPMYITTEYQQFLLDFSLETGTSKK